MLNLRLKRDQKNNFKVRCFLGFSDFANLTTSIASFIFTTVCFFAYYLAFQVYSLQPTFSIKTDWILITCYNFLKKLAIFKWFFVFSLLKMWCTVNDSGQTIWWKVFAWVYSDMKIAENVDVDESCMLLWNLFESSASVMKT